MMQMVLREEGRPMLQRIGTDLVCCERQRSGFFSCLTCPHKQTAEVRDKPRTLTVGKVNLIRHEVKRAEQLGPAVFFRKGV